MDQLRCELTHGGNQLKERPSNLEEKKKIQLWKWCESKKKTENNTTPKTIFGGLLTLNICLINIWHTIFI